MAGDRITPTVILDCDAVLANWAGAFCKLAREIWEYDGVGVSPLWYPDYELIEYHGTDRWPGWTKKLTAATWHEAKARSSWFLTVPPIDAEHRTITALQELRDRTKLYVVTARPDCAGLPMNALTSMWIMKNFGVALPVIAIQGAARKCHVIAALRPQFVLDDSPDVLLQLMALPKATRGAVVKRAYQYNAHVKADASVTSVALFRDLVMGVLDDTATRD